MKDISINLNLNTLLRTVTCWLFWEIVSSLITTDSTESQQKCVDFISRGRSYSRFPFDYRKDNQGTKVTRRRSESDDEDWRSQPPIGRGPGGRKRQAKNKGRGGARKYQRGEGWLLLQDWGKTKDAAEMTKIPQRLPEVGPREIAVTAVFSSIWFYRGSWQARGESNVTKYTCWCRLAYAGYDLQNLGCAAGNCWLLSPTGPFLSWWRWLWKNIQY